MSPAVATAKEIFLAALERTTPAERAAFLAASCGDDALRRRVEALLAAHDEPDSRLDRPAAEAPPTNLFRPITEAPGMVIGPYKLRQKIGEGGFGIVFMAEQEKPVHRMVALKIIKPGMDTAQVIARFESERQALAIMDHPHIARVLEAGATDSGRPYFVMELVKGVPITEFCDKNHLPPEGRLKLFIDVCHAIQHAHHKGVIHRDIKPSNVMVTLHDGVPVVKVIDFGVAKATVQKLTEKTLFTAYGQMIGTPAYMSPEQAEMSGLDIDTRSDVYSLGVLLYELLTGTTPLESKRLREAGYGEMQRMIRDEEAPRPSTRLSSLGDSATVLAGNRGLDVKHLVQLLAGDLDWMVMKALEKDRNRRYGTPGNFAEDIDRYLRREAILARPPSTAYKLKKFTQRNRAAVLTATAVAATLLIGTVVATWQAVRATRAETLAIAATNDEKQAKEAAQAAQRGEATQRAIAVEQAARASREADYSRRLAYAADMNLAQQTWEAGDSGRARALLERQWPQAGQQDLRDFEWRYLWPLCQDVSRQTLRGHTGAITAIALSPDGQTVAASSSDSSVRIWDLASQRHWKLVFPYIKSVAFAPDGKTLACVEGFSRCVRLWDVGTHSETGIFQTRSTVNDAAFSPDGKLIALACYDGTVGIWDVATRQEVDNVLSHPGGVFCVRFSPDGKTFASAGMRLGVRLWDVATRRETTTFEKPSPDRLTFSPDGKTLASVGFDGYVWLRDTTTGQAVDSLRVSRTPLRAIAFSPDGKFLATGGSDGTVRLWDATTNQITSLLRGHTGTITALEFSTDSRSLVSGAEDGAIKIWSVAPSSDPNTLTGYASSIPSLAISPNGKLLAVAESVGKMVHLYDVATRQHVAQLAGHEKAVTCVAFAPDGQTLASVSADGSIWLWDVTTHERLADFHNKDAIRSAAFSPDGRFLAVSETNHNTFVWEIATRRQVARIAGTSAQFAPNGARMATRVVNTIRLWDVATWQPVSTLTGHKSEVVRLAFAPDGGTLATGSADGTLQVWDIAKQRQVGSSRGHTSDLKALSFSPDGRRLATGGADGLVKIWDVDLLQEVVTFVGHQAAVYAVQFSPDCKTLATGGQDRTVRLWHAPPLPAGVRPPTQEPRTPAPIETVNLLAVVLGGTAQATRALEGNIHRVDVTAVDGNNHVLLTQLFDDLQEGETYTVRFRAKADVAQQIMLRGQIHEPNWHNIGLRQRVSLSDDWQLYQYDFQAKDLAAANSIYFELGDQIGTFWFADFSVTKTAK